MFQFPEFASYTYVFSAWYPTYVGWVSPFRHLWIKVCLPTPQSFSQAPTSFIASNCQGIHRMRLVAWPYMINRYCAQSSTLLCTFTFIAVLIECCHSSFDFAINMKFISPDLYAWFESLRYSFLNFFSFNYYLVKEHDSMSLINTLIDFMRPYRHATYKRTSQWLLHSIRQ